MTILKTLSLLTTAALLPMAAQATDAAVAQMPTKPVASKLTGKTVTKGQLRTQKSRLGVTIDYTVTAPSATGGVWPIQLTVRRADTAEPLTVELTPDAGLAMPTGLPGGSAVQTTATASYQLGVLPRSTDGIYYVNVFLRSRNMTEALAIPVQSGKNAVVAKPVAVQTMPNGERVISIPAN